MRFLSALFDHKAREEKRLLKSVPEEQREALQSILAGQTDFRNHPEFQDNPAVLAVERGGDKIKYVDLLVSQIPDTAKYEKPCFAFGGLWPSYSTKVETEPKIEPVYKKTIPLTLKGGKVLNLDI